MQGLDGLPKLKGLAGLPGLGKRQDRLKLDVAGVSGAENLRDEKAAQMERLLHDAQLVKRVRKLQARYPNGTLPEMVAMDWLIENGQSFEYQVGIHGGRATRGGLVSDFVVFHSTTADVWFIQGDYWHSRLGNVSIEKNTADKLRTVGQWVNGVRIEKALELWERRIYEQRPNIFVMAMAGIELGR